MLRPIKTLNQKKKIKQDKFVTWLFSTGDTLQTHGKNLLYGIGALAVIMLVVFLVRRSSTGAQQEAKLQLDQGDYYAETNKPEDALNVYMEMLRKFGRSAITGRACFSVATIYLHKSENDSALTYFQKFIDKYQGPLLMPAAVAGLAMCWENKKEYAKAAEQYQKVAHKYAKSYLAPEYLMSAARCYQQIGKTVEADNCYQTIVKNYKKTDYLRDAETADKMVLKK